MTGSLYATMRQNPRVIGVKNSSMPVQDIQMFVAAGGEDYIVLMVQMNNILVVA